MILADDVEKWDSESKKLLGKLMALQSDIKCSFSKDTVFVLTTNNIKSLNIKISNYYHEVINVDLSYKSFLEEAKIRLCLLFNPRIFAISLYRYSTLYP